MYNTTAALRGILHKTKWKYWWDPSLLFTAFDFFHDGLLFVLRGMELFGQRVEPSWMPTEANAGACWKQGSERGTSNPGCYQELLVREAAAHFSSVNKGNSCRLSLGTFLTAQNPFRQTPISTGNASCSRPTARESEVYILSVLLGKIKVLIKINLQVYNA